MLADEQPDAVDRIVEQWHRERPELDTSGKEITGRLVRISSLFQQAQADAFAGLGITETEFGILAPLRRVGAPFQLTPTELARQRMMTSGGMTAAIDRLERKGMVERRPNPDDRRGSLVHLTTRGREVIDAAMAVHADVERSIVAGLDEDQRAQLVGLLRVLLHDLEGA